MNEKNLVHHLSQLKSVSPRPDWVSQNREVLSYQIFNGQESPAISLSFISRVNIITHRLLQPTPIAAMIVLFFMISGVVSINASRNTTPNNALYIAKIIAEKAAVATTFDEKGKAQLSVEHAKNRATELKIMSQNSQDNDPRVQELSDNFKKEIAAVRDHLTKLDEEAAKQATIDAQASSNPKLNLTTKPKTTDTKETTDDEKVFSADSGKDEKGIQVSMPASIALEEAEKLFNEKKYNEALDKLGEIEIK